MRYLKRISGLLMILMLLALSACGGGAATVNPAPIYTQLASTALALQTQTALVQPTATLTPQFSPTPLASNTPLLTDTPLPGASSATPIVLSTQGASCNNAEYITDVNYGDGYQAVPGEVMQKAWRVKNLGPCTWTKDYVLAFGYGGEGTDWASTRPVHFEFVIPPGENLEISVTLKAPSASGEYSAVFRLQDDKGFFFGPTLTILIKV